MKITTNAITSTRGPSRRDYFSIFVLGALLATLNVVRAESSPDAASAQQFEQMVEAASGPTGAEKRVFRAPPEKMTVQPWMSDRRIVLKFSEGTKIRLRNGRFTSLVGTNVGPVQSVLARSGITGSQIQPLFDRPEADLRREKAEGEARTGRQLADLSQYYLIELKGNRDIGAVCDALNALNIVESAFPQAKPAPAPATSTPDFTYTQAYKNEVSAGIGVDSVSSVPGVDGQDITIADIEYSWQLDHEDLQLPASANVDYGIATIDDPFDDTNHGTAVLGMLVGKNNDYGVTGIVPQATAIVAPERTGEYGPNRARAINKAVENTLPGDIILLEMQTWVCGGDYGPAEWEQSVFDAVQHATALGRVVVAAAGNGNVDLDSPACNGLFNRSVRDSGAIIVGAGEAGTNNKASFSSYGSRLDAQGWGNWTVATTGYGDLQYADGDIRRMYTSTFAGTSSASPMVAGAAAAIQGVRKAAGDYLYTSSQMRIILTLTGTPQGSGGHIGPLPNVLKALVAGYGWESIDILGNDDSNYIDVDAPSPSYINVSVLTTNAASGDWRNFDAGQMKDESVRFGPAEASITFQDEGLAYDIDSDGDVDRLYFFDTAETGIACEDTSAILTGETISGEPVKAMSYIQTPYCPDGGCH